MSLWWSQLWLDGTNALARQALTDCHAMHRLVMTGFGTKAGNREEQGVLYRVEPDGGRATPAVLVQSTAEPNWTLIPRDAVVRCQPKAVDELIARIAPGTVWRFRLRANPTKKVDTWPEADGRRRNGRRLALTDSESQVGWLKRKAEAGGFDLLSLQVTDEPPPPLGRERVLFGGGRGRQPLSAGGHRPLTFGAVLFDGLLRVTDAGTFRQTLAQGIGSGKAFGFGLLSVAPVGAGR